MDTYRLLMKTEICEQEMQSVQKYTWSRIHALVAAANKQVFQQLLQGF